MEECTDDQTPYCRDLSDSVTKCTDSVPLTTDLDPGSTCQVKCSYGQVLSGGVEIVTCDDEGEWTGQLGTCSDPVCEKLDIENGSLYCR